MSFSVAKLRAWQEYTKTIGNTPLIHVAGRVFAKLETGNPTGSIKDRPISYMISYALKCYEITPGQTFVEASSGNAGISLAACGAVLGSQVVITMPCNMSDERKKMIKAFGAEIIEVGPHDFEAAIRQRDDLILQNNAWSPRQFENGMNFVCHSMTTAWEIDRDLALHGKQWDEFIAGAGTGGTIRGICVYLRNHSLSSRTHVTLVKPDESAGPHGIQGIGDGKDFLVDHSLVSRTISISTVDAIDAAKQFAKSHGIMVGISSGANLAAAKIIEETSNGTGAIVCVLADRGERYMSVM